MKPAASVLAALVVFGVALGAGPPRPAAPARQVVGVLEEVDFIHRTGRFRARPGGECVEFALTPEAVIEYLSADADLRDLPLGSAYTFALHPDAAGRFTRAAFVRHRFTAAPQPAATARQRRHYAAFVKARGLPARVERTAGRTLTLSVFGGDPAVSEQTWPGDSSHPGHGVRVAVANDELRTWNPPVDHESGKIVEFRKIPTGRRVRLVVTVNFMLEGFRRGHYVRVFPDAWPLKDQPFGEQLFHYGARAFPPELAENTAKEYPQQYPFRTDFGNAHLGWYRLKPGVAPPPDSEHRVVGELLAVGADRRSGRFRFDNTSDEVDFRLIPKATVRHLNAAANLTGLPVGVRYRFHLYQDDAGAFRRVSFVTDEVSDLVHNGAVWRVESVNRGDGVLVAARQPPGFRNDQGDPEQPPDIGRSLLRTGPDTRVWKGKKQAGLADLSVGDLLLINRTGDRPGRPSRCVDIWVGAEAHKQLPRGRRKEPTPPLPKGTPR